MEFFYVVKATQKSGKEDAVIWFTAKSEARANLQLDVELEDAGIETGRGKDYAKPVRTDFPVYNDLPEESTVDYTWCKRYELQGDGRTWLPKAGAESTGAVDNTAAPEQTVKVETTVESVPVENRTPAVRYAVHLTSDKYQSHITKEQQLAASEMSLDEGNTYLQNLLLAKNDIPEVAELSLNAEWKLVQAIKQVFAPDEAHETEIIAAFMADWARADAGDRNQLVEEWRSGKLNLLKSEITSDADFTTDQVPEPENGIQIDENDDETTRYPVVRMPFRKQLLAQFTADELRHHLTREEYEGMKRSWLMPSFHAAGYWPADLIMNGMGHGKRSLENSISVKATKASTGSQGGPWLMKPESASSAAQRLKVKISRENSICCWLRPVPEILLSGLTTHASNWRTWPSNAGRDCSARM